MSKLTIVANIVAKPDKVEVVKVALQGLVATTRAEAGCLQYDLHQDNDNPTHFVFYENWESRELWQAHMNAPHLHEYGAATTGAIEKFSLNEMTQIA